MGLASEAAGIADSAALRLEMSLELSFPSVKFAFLLALGSQSELT